MAALNTVAPKPSYLLPGVFGVALVGLVLGAPGGVWDAGAGHAVLAAHLEHTAAAPLYGALAGLAAALPVGEVGFRLAVLGALLGALTLTGVVAAARALLPKDPVAGVIGAAVLAVTPPLRDATAFATPTILAAAGLVWTLAAVITHARVATPRAALGALVGVVAVLGSAPWLGAALAILVVGWLARSGASRELLAVAVGAIGVTLVAWWWPALGRLPDFAPSLTSVVAATGRGAAAIVVGGGLLGAAFAALTGLPAARGLALVIAVAAVHAIVVDHQPTVLLAGLAIGVAVIPSAVVRVVGSAHRTSIALAAGAPLVGLAFVTGAAFTVDDPGAAPARLATDVIGALPPGPGAIVLTSGTRWSAVHYAQEVAGARPDLGLAPPLPPEIADGFVADNLRALRIVGADVPAIGRLDPTRAVPRGRGFELRGDVASDADLPPAPAHYASATGEEQAISLALIRARHEAASGHLAAAARAAGLVTRFHAADLALLATATPTRERPALFGFVPRFPEDTARTRLDLLGDDLAWVAGLEQPALATPRSRHLHALWREVLAGKRTPDDADIAALGEPAIAATRALFVR